jgi:alkylated DNA repair dioxygenase AlkB
MDPDIIYLYGTTYIKQFPLPEPLRIDDEGFEVLWALKPDTQATFRIYGKEIPIPRFQLLLGHGYRFSGKSHLAEDFNLENPGHQILRALLDYVCQETKCEYNGLIVNFYRDGHDYIGPHRDDTRDLVPDSEVWSVSFGGTRKFKLVGPDRHTFMLHDNEVLIMGGDCQTHYKHSVPKCVSTERRINVTMRRFK